MLKKDFDELQVGDWCFMNDDTYIGLRIGTGENDICILPIFIESVDKPVDKTAWKWTGNKESPSLTPSILHWGNGHKEPSTWHGYLTDGKLVEV